MGIDDELERLGYQYYDSEAPVEIWINRKTDFWYKGQMVQNRSVMEMTVQHSELVLLNGISKEEFARLLTDLINNDHEVQKAILNLAFSCPNIVTQIQVKKKAIKK